MADFSQQTAVYVSQYPANHSERNFAQPHEFIPERWLGEDDRFAKDKFTVWNPFNMGPRNCIGKKYVTWIKERSALLPMRGKYPADPLFIASQLQKSASSSPNCFGILTWNYTQVRKRIGLIKKSLLCGRNRRFLSV